MAELNRDKPYDHAHGLVQGHEPFFFQDGFAFTAEGVEVFKDEMGNFTVLSTSAKGKKAKLTKVEAPVITEAPIEILADEAPAIAEAPEDSI